MTASKKAYGPFQGSIVGLMVHRREGYERAWPATLDERGRIILAWLDRDQVWISVVDSKGRSAEMKLTDVILEELR